MVVVVIVVTPMASDSEDVAVTMQNSCRIIHIIIHCMLMMIASNYFMANGTAINVIMGRLVVVVVVVAAAAVAATAVVVVVVGVASTGVVPTAATATAVTSTFARVVSTMTSMASNWLIMMVRSMIVVVSIDGSRRVRSGT